jgi:hypothetical protein
MADTVNGAATAEPHGKAKQITLPSGATAEVRKGRGKDLMRAHRAVRGKDDPMAISFALIAELTNIDGKTIVYEDVLEMNLSDVLALQTEIMGSDFQLPPLPSSPASSSSDSQSRN